MLFYSYVFVFVFFPLCLLGLLFLRKKGSGALLSAYLTAVSLGFALYAGFSTFFVLAGSMLFHYLLFVRMNRSPRKRLCLAVGLLVDLGALGLFKYGGMTEVPLGISFFTFSQIAFLMEGYRGNLKDIRAGEYTVYLTFFPKLAQGPLMLPEEMTRQLREEKPIDYEGIYRGLVLFVLGLGKKVLLADVFGRAVDYGYANLSSLHTWDALIVMLSYTLQIYFDFSGYCDMAMGIAGMMGFTLPLNFNAPYRAENILEFWKRWHMTLTRFFTRYLYIPLGGSRKGEVRSYVNMLAVFLISGLWHGAGPTFLVWGAMHGVLYVITKWMAARRPKKGTEGRGIHAGKVAATFLFVNGAWVFFRAPSLEAAFSLFGKIGSLEFSRVNPALADCFRLDEFWYVIKVLGIDGWQYAYCILMVLMLAAALLIVFLGRTAVELAGRVRPGAVTTVLLAALFVWCVVSFSEVSSFIYVNF